MKSQSIVIIGSSNTDLIIKTSRIPAPGETIIGGEFVTAAGGKCANQAVAAARLGADVTFIARIGKDDFGDRSIENFKRENINVKYSIRDKATPSGIAIIIVDREGENSIVVASGSNWKLTPANLVNATPLIKKAGVLLMQLETPLDCVTCAAKIAHEAGVMTILNPAPARSLSNALLKMITILTPNESEASLLSGIDVKDEASAQCAAEVIRKKGVKTVIITMGSKGSLLVSENIVKKIPTKKIKAIDTTAAGDAFNGALAYSLAQGRALEKAVYFANHVGALSATKMGAQPSLPTVREVERFMKE